MIGPSGDRGGPPRQSDDKNRPSPSPSGREGSSSPDSHRRFADRRRDRDDWQQRGGVRSGAEVSVARSPPPSAPPRVREEPEVYGLQGGSSSARRRPAPDGSGDRGRSPSLGPDPNLLARRREERERATSAASERRRRRNAGDGTNTTAGGRAEALRAMQEDAVRRENHLAKEVAGKGGGGSDSAGLGHDSTGDPEFLQDLTAQAYGSGRAGGSGSSMAERVRRGRHTNQSMSSSFF